jgi:hypothetical protein
VLIRRRRVCAKAQGSAQITAAGREGSATPTAKDTIGDRLLAYLTMLGGQRLPR